MKKIILLIVAVPILVLRVFCTAGVPENFYLDGAAEERRILPNTLRTELLVGESEEVFVDGYPQKNASGVSWELKNNNGTVSLFPSGERCTLLANAAGEETVLICLHGEPTAEISVRVSALPEVSPRTFELPAMRDNREELLAKIFKVIIYLLTAGGTGLCIFAAISFIGRARK